MRNLYFYFFIFICCFCLRAMAAEPFVAQLTIPPAKLVLSTAIKPLAKRESKFTPEEYDIVQALRPLLEREDYDAALSELNTREKTLKSDYSPALLFVRAQLYIHQKRFALAQADLKAALVVLPDFVRGHQGMAMLYLAQQNWRPALASLTQAISLGGGDAELYGQLGYLHLRNSDAWAASAAYQQALMLAPENKYYKQGLLSALLQSKQFASARNLVERLIKDAPSDKALWLRRASIALQTDDQSVALASIEAAIRLGEDSFDNHLVAARLHIQRGNYVRGTELLERAVAAGHWDVDQIQRVVQWLAREAQWSQVERLLTAVKPHLAELGAGQRSQYHLSRGQLALARGEKKTARGAYDAAVKADPANGQALLASAALMAEQKRYVQAELLYVRAQAIDSVREAAMLNLAQLYIDRQDYPAALELLRTAHRDYPQNHGLAKNIDTLVSIINVGG